MEWLGDAVIEVYTIFTAKRCLDINKISHKPEDLHNFKPLLLSCFPLTCFSIILDFYKFVPDKSHKITQELLNITNIYKLYESKSYYCIK